MELRDLLYASPALAILGVFVCIMSGAEWIALPLAVAVAVLGGVVAVGFAVKSVVFVAEPAASLGGRLPKRVRHAPHAHSKGGSQAGKADLWRHENGHARLLRRYGVGVGAQRVWQNRNGSWQGYTMPGSWYRMDRLPKEQQIAIYAAGGIAMGSTSHNGSDDVQIKYLARGDGSLARRGQELARRDL
jgi:uncharacterized membrane protein